MDCIFNELSLEEEISDKTSAINLMGELIQLCKEINKLCKKPMKLRVVADFWQRDLVTGYSIQNWLKDNNVSREYRSLLLKILDAPTLNESLILEKETEYLESTFEYQDELIKIKCDGLGISYMSGKSGTLASILGEKGTLAVSLNSHPRWNEHEIKLLCFSNNQQKEVTIKHASQKIHIEKNKCFILIVKSDEYTPPSLSNPFPNLIQSNKLVNNDWSEFQSQLDRYKDQKLSTIHSMADKVARINGYKNNNSLSSLNQQKISRREIYEAGNDRNKIYLSVDFEKGAFELCNHIGEHQGEYKFNGEKSGVAKSDHSIFLK